MHDPHPQPTGRHSSPRLGYLSSGARVSTRSIAELVGPRSHVLGTISGYKELGWDVAEYIVGDKVPESWVKPGSENVTRSGGTLKTLGVDMVRLAMGGYHSVRAGLELKHRVDWVYERGALLQVMGWMFKRRGIPWILETNSLQWKEAAENRDSLVLESVARRMELWSYAACDVVAPVSEALRDILVENGVDPQKIVVVPNGVNLQSFNPESVDASKGPGTFTVGFVGALSSWQALPLLFRAVSELRTEENLDIGITIVGDGHARKEWEAEVRRLALGDRVEFEGFQPHDRVPAYIKGFDVGYSGPVRLATGNMYMSPLKLYEYLAMATPVVAAGYEDAERLLSQSDAGFLFEPENKNDLKRALREAYREDCEVLREKGRSGREMVRKHHSWTARVKHLNEETRRIIGGPRS